MAIAAATFVKLFPVVALALAVFRPRRIRSGAIFAAVLAAGVALPLLVTSPSSLAMQYRSWYAIETRDVAPLAALRHRRRGPVRGDHGPVPRLVGRAVAALAHAARRRARCCSLRSPCSDAASTSRHFRLLFLASMLVFCVLFNHQAESPSYSIAIDRDVDLVRRRPRARGGGRR